MSEEVIVASNSSSPVSNQAMGQTVKMTDRLLQELIHQQEWDLAKDVAAVRYAIYLAYGFIFLLGLSGNSLVIFVVVRGRHMRASITNLFIANLGISDVLMTLVATPFTPFSIFSDDWWMPDVLCKVLPMTMGVSVYVSTLTSMGIAIHRYLVLVHPLVPKMSRRLCTAIIFAIWSVALFISSPLALFQKKEPRHDVNSHSANVNRVMSVCDERWPQEGAPREVFTLISFVLQFVLPCVVITFCYRQVSQVLVRRCNSKMGSRRERVELRRKRRTTKMLIAMVAIFVVCWIPLNTLWLVTDLMRLLNVASDHWVAFVVPSTPSPSPQTPAQTKSFGLLEELNFHSPSNSKGAYFTLIFCAIHLVAMSSAVYNPFLYAGLNENFRTELRSIFPFLFPVRRASSHDRQLIPASDHRKIHDFHHSSKSPKEHDSESIPHQDSSNQSDAVAMLSFTNICRGDGDSVFLEGTTAPDGLQLKISLC